MEGIENRSFLLKAALVVGGGGLIFGYDIGVISTTITAMKEDISMDDISEGWVMGIMGVGAIVGAIIAGPLCDVMGRWRTIQLQNVLFCAGSIVTGCARGLDGLYIGRFIIGMASAVSSVADIPYLNEISPPSVRGQVTSAYELLTSLGVLLSFLVGWLCVGGADSSHSINDNEGSGSGSGWRAAFLLPVALALAQSLGMLSLPESPQWLLEKQRAEEAGAALQLVHGKAAFEAMCMRWEGRRRRQEMMVTIGGLPPRLLGSSHGGTDTRHGAESPIHPHYIMDSDPGDVEMTCPAIDNASTSAAAAAAAAAASAVSVSVSVSVSASEDADVSGGSGGYHYPPDGYAGAGAGAGAGEDSASDEDADVAAYCELKAAAATISSSSSSSWRRFRGSIPGDLKVFTEYRYPVLIVLLVQALTQLSGGVVVRNYADALFQMQGYSSAAALGFTALLGLFKFAFTVGAVYALEAAGRKLLFVAGCLVIAFGLLLLVVSSAMQANAAAAEAATGVSTVVQVAAVALVVSGYGIGYGPVAWILSTELVPVSIRGKTMALALICQSAFLTLTNVLFLSMLRTMQAVGTFSFFLVANLVGAGLCVLFLVESKAKSPETILRDLRKRYRDVCSCFIWGTHTHHHEYLNVRDERTAAAALY